MNSKHTLLSSLNNHIARALSTCAKLCRRLGQGVADFVLASGQMPSPVRAPEIAAFTALAAERRNRVLVSQGAPTAALLVSASLSRCV